MSLLVAFLVLVNSGALVDSTNMRFVGNWPFGPMNAMVIDMDDSLIFMASGGGIRIFQVSSLTDTPQMVSEIHCRYRVESMLYRNSYLYVGLAEDGMRVYSLADVHNPVLVASPSDGYGIYDMKFYGRYIMAIEFMRMGTYNLQHMITIDISDPSNPNFYTPMRLANIGHIYIKNTYAIVTMMDSGIVVFDLTRPLRPVRYSTFNSGRMITNLLIHGNYAYASSGSNYISILDISNLRSIFETGYFSYSGFQSTHSLAYKNDTLYIADSWGKIWILDVSNVHSPTLLDSICLPILPNEIMFQDSLTFVEDRYSGIYLMNISNHQAVTTLWRLNAYFYSGRIRVFNHMAFIAYVRSGFDIVDVSDPQNPTLIYEGRIDSGEVYDVNVEGNYMFVTGKSLGIEVYDISTPSNPVFITRINTDTTIYSMELKDTLLYAMDFDGYIEIFDISDITNPVFVNSVYEGHIERMITTDSAGFLLKSNMIMAVDLDNPELSEIDRHYIVTGGAEDMALKEDFVYVVTTGGAMEIYHYFNNRLYDPIIHYDTLGENKHIVIDGDTLFLGNDDGILAFDIRDFRNISRIGSYTGFSVVNLDASNGYVYASLGDIGLNIFQLTNAIDISETPIFSHNKIRVKVTGNSVNFSAGKNTEGTITLYDALGRKILNRNFTSSFNVTIPRDGIYFWIYQSNAGKRYRGKILIVK